MTKKPLNKQQIWEEEQHIKKEAQKQMFDQAERQKNFRERVNAASTEIMQIMKRYEIDMQCETKIGDVTLNIPVKFSDKKDYSKPIEPEIVALEDNPDFINDILTP